MKPILWLDKDMRKTHHIPEDGALYNTWLDLCYDLQFADSEEPDQEIKARKALDDFHYAHKFKEVPLIMQQTLLFGAAAAFRGYGRDKNNNEVIPALDRPKTTPPSVMPEKSFVTHPDNVAGLTPEQREGLDIRIVEVYNWLQPKNENAP